MSSLNIGFLAHPEGDKCYKVSEDYEGNSIFVWARFNAEARREGANHLDLTWDDVECSRFKELDHFEGDLLDWCLDHGWWFGCLECETHCYRENAHIIRGDVFCSEEHGVKYHAHWDQKRALEAQFLAYAKIHWPEEEPYRASVNVGNDGIIYTNRGMRIVDRVNLSPQET